MRVLVIHTSYKMKGGEDSVVLNEIELLKLNHVKVDLLHFSNGNETALKFLQLPFNVDSYHKTRKKIKEFKPDIAHIHNLHFGASASIIKALDREHVPYVLTVHNYRLLCPSATLFNKGEIFLHSVKRNFPWNAVFNGVYQNSRVLTLWVGFSMFLHQMFGTWKSCRKFIVLSEHSKALLMNSKMKMISDRIVIKPNFCYAPSIPDFRGNNFFLYIGRLSEEKGIMLLLSSFSACSLPLKIVGSGPLANTVLQYSKQYPNIECIDSLTNDEVFNLLQNCSALVCPSTGYETFGMVVIESFAVGKPVIASRLGAMENLVTDHYNGLLFDPGSKTDLTDKLAIWQSMTAEEKDRLGKNARSTYENKYTPERNATQLLDIYHSVLEDSRLLQH